MSSPPVFGGVHVTRSLSWCVIFCRSLFVLFLLSIASSVLHRFTDYDYPFGFFKHILLNIFAWYSITDPVISHECEKDRRVFTTSGTYRWYFNKRIQNERNCLNYEYVFNNDNLLNYYGHFHTEETYYVIDRDVTQQLQRSPLSQKTKNKTNKNKQASKQKNVFQISSIHIHIFSQLIQFFSGNTYDIFY
jgi:hypothetical protein